MLKALSLKPVYDSEKDDLIRDLQAPLLAHSKDYLRGVGFFTSGWLRLAAKGLIALIEAGGKARFVVSPILGVDDWVALQQGDAAQRDTALQTILSRSVTSLALSLEQDTRNALAWMVSQKILEFRFAIPRERHSIGMYHDKVGIFTDECGNQVAIHGSLNDSAAAEWNGEAFSVFTSWEEGKSAYVNQHRTRLESLWNNTNRQFYVCGVPDAVREQMIKLRTTVQSPYKFPRPPGLPSNRLTIPRSLRPYQETAVKNWRDSGYRGVFEMATGTGKTLTALAAAVSAYDELGRLAIVVLVPYLHLLEQWESVCREFGFDPILCSGDHPHWNRMVKSAIRDFNLGIRHHLCLLNNRA